MALPHLISVTVYIALYVFSVKSVDLDPAVICVIS